MKVRGLIGRGILFGTWAVLCMPLALRGQESSASPAIDSSDLSHASEFGDAGRSSVDIARDRAKIMHEIYATTLHVMHQRYFHGPRAVVPARAMEDVFAEIKQQSQVEARWISVNTKAMSINHEPGSDFEKRAAQEIAAGKPEWEAVEDGFYRRAAAIPLTGGCIGCHEGLFKGSSKKPKFAGLVISVPVRGDAGQPD